MAIHPMAYVHPEAQIADEVEIGPFASIGADVTIGPRCDIGSNVTITGHTTLGADNRIWPGAVIGTEPQDISYQGSPTRVEIGDRNYIRECVTINRATEKAEGVTRIGNENFLMACCKCRQLTG